MGFIAYQHRHGAGSESVRIFLECMPAPEERAPETGSGLSCSFAVEVEFPGGGEECRLRGIDSVLPLKKFYKLVFSLEERAREHGNDWRSVMQSPGALLQHLGYTRNARDLTGRTAPALRPTADSAEPADADCAAATTARG